MSTSLQPPQTPPSPTGPTSPPSAGTSRVIAILVACFGGLVVLGTLGSAVFSSVASGMTHTSTRTAPASGVGELDADVSSGSLEIVFADVEDAELTVRGAFGADRWSLERDGDALVVSSPRGWFGGGFWPFGGAGDAVLTLPRTASGLSADLELSAGELTAEGAFDELDVTVNAGRAEIEGDANELTVEVNAGRADVVADGVREASLSVSAGELDTTLGGRQPDAIVLEVSAGSLTATVPDGEYRVTSDVSAGGFDNRIDSDPSASSAIDVRVSAGQATLRTGR